MPVEPPAGQQYAARPSAADEGDGGEWVEGSEVPGSVEEPSANPAPYTTGALQVVGSQLCGEDGQPVQLRGVSTHGLSWYPEYVNQPLFTQLRNDWGASVVRLAMYTAEYGGYCTDGDPQQLYQLVRNGVDYATAADLYVIVDWHILSDDNPLQNADAAADFFSRMSADLAQNNNVIYEICNEPNGNTTWADIKAYAQRIIPLIRVNDPDAVVIVGTPTWSQEVDKAAADPLGFDNVMYAMHFYAATHKQELRDRLAAAVEGGLPVFVTEFGICDASGNGQIDYQSADAWVQLMDRLNVSYLCWNLSNKNEASALFKPDCEKTSNFTTDDLSAEGLWLWDVLHEDAKAGGAANSGERNDAPNDGSTNAASGNGADSSGAAIPGTLSGSTGLLDWTAKAVNSWESNGEQFAQYDITVTNAGSAAVGSWEIEVPFQSGVEISDSWNGQFSVQGKTLTIKSVDYNGNLSQGASATDIGVIVSGWL